MSNLTNGYIITQNLDGTDHLDCLYRISRAGGWSPLPPAAPPALAVTRRGTDLGCSRTQTALFLTCANVALPHAKAHSMTRSTRLLTQKHQ